MAFRGVKPKPNHLRVVDGTPAKKIVRDPAQDISPDHDNGLKPHQKLTKRQQELWDEYIIRIPWLTHLDRPKAYMWVREMETYETDKYLPASAKANLRSLSSDLGMDAPSRTRVKPSDAKTKEEKYFDD